MKYLLWDFDNTLAFRESLWSESLRQVLLKHGIEQFDYEKISPLMQSGFLWHYPEKSHEELLCGKSWWGFMNEHFERILIKLGADTNTAKAVSLGLKDEYLDVKKWHLFEETKLALQKSVKLGFKNIIASNHVPELEQLVHNLGIGQYFDKIFSSANVGYEKPNLNFYNSVLEGIKSDDFSDITMIGDNYTADICGALNAGIDAILVRSDNEQNYPKYSKDLMGIFELLSN